MCVCVYLYMFVIINHQCLLKYEHYFIYCVEKCRQLNSSLLFSSVGSNFICIKINK